MILVTGATGNVGSALPRELRETGAAPVRGLTRDAARAPFPVGVDAVEGDLARTASLKSALDGVRSPFPVSRVGADADTLTAARQAGVEHVALVSSITVQTHPLLPAAGENLAVERLLQDSGMGWTVLRPTRSRESPAQRPGRSSSGPRRTPTPSADVLVSERRSGDEARLAPG